MSLTCRFFLFNVCKFSLFSYFSLVRISNFDWQFPPQSVPHVTRSSQCYIHGRLCMCVSCACHHVKQGKNRQLCVDLLYIFCFVYSFFIHLQWELMSDLRAGICSSEVGFVSECSTCNFKGLLVRLLGRLAGSEKEFMDIFF